MVKKEDCHETGAPAAVSNESCFILQMQRLRPSLYRLSPAFYIFWAEALLSEMQIRKPGKNKDLEVNS